MPRQRTKVFISYSHRDAEWLDHLHIHLKPLERSFALDIWDDTKISVGTKWREEIELALSTSKVAVLLVSPYFLASDFIAKNELPPLLKAAENEGLKVLTLVISPCRLFRTEGISDYQVMNPPTQSLIEMCRADQERLLVRVTEEIEKTLTSVGEATVAEPEMPFATNGQFDVFLAHNSKDKVEVEGIAKALQEHGVKVWLDKWELIPGRSWQEALEQVIQSAKTAAVLIGQEGLGPWEIPEMRACLSEFASRGLPVIPVLLPGVLTKPELPLFLKGLTWVDLREGISAEGIRSLLWGITGNRT